MGIFFRRLKTNSQMDNQRQVVYQKEYRDKYGDLMREQIKEWRKSHPDYYREYRKKNHHRLRVYWREYRRRERIQKSS